MLLERFQTTEGQTNVKQSVRSLVFEVCGLSQMGADFKDQLQKAFGTT